MNNKTLSHSVSDFSKKLSRFNESGKTELERPLSSDAKLQMRISDMETERRERFLQQYNSLKNPVSQQVEQDEENLIAAYNLFKGAVELNASSSSAETKIADLRISSPICSKNEYINGSGFSFLRIWFLKTNEGAEYVPLISQKDDKRFLEFIPVDEYEFSRLEKEILQIIPE